MCDLACEHLGPSRLATILGGFHPQGEAKWVTACELLTTDKVAPDLRNSTTDKVAPDLRNSTLVQIAPDLRNSTFVQMNRLGRQHVATASSWSHGGERHRFYRAPTRRATLSIIAHRQIHEGQGIPKRKQPRFRVDVVYSHASRYMRGVYIHRVLLTSPWKHGVSV